MMGDEKQKTKTPHELARARELASRAQTDLGLLAAATRATSLLGAAGSAASGRFGRSGGGSGTFSGGGGGGTWV